MKHKVSVLTWCFSRQEMLDITLPKWLDQTGTDFEIICGVGPDIIIPFVGRQLDYRLEIVNTPNLKMCESYNAMLKQSTGDILLITQCDMELNSPTQLKRMSELCDERTMVTEKFFNKGKRDKGVYLQCMMVYKSAVERAGGWCELYDNPESAAHEDADLVATMLEQGMKFKHIETPKDEGVYHLDHPRPDYINDPVMLKRLAKGYAIYKSRHEYDLPVLYYKQMVQR
jgi:hypothetical protein